MFRWFCGLDPAEAVFDATAFTHNRPRLDENGITAAFFDAVVKRAWEAGLCSDEHFSVAPGTRHADREPRVDQELAADR